MPSSSRRRSDHAEPLLDWQLDEIREAFNIFDADATGKVSYSELRAAMRALNYNPKRSELR
jgi:Ca2+-binding EF-hand superfamily protein